MSIIKLFLRKKVFTFYITAMTIIVISFVSLYFISPSLMGDVDKSYILKNIIIASGLILVFYILFSYLQSGGKGTERNDDSLLIDFVEYRLDEINERIKKYESTIGLTDEDKKTTINNVVNKISEDTIKTIFENESIKLKNDIKENLGFEKLLLLSKNITQRLNREIKDLRLRSNMNLMLGIAITAGGLYLLMTTVLMIDSSELLKNLASESSDSNDKFFKNLMLPLVPRISLVVFIEIFAYFFLRMYKNGLSEIKYFQNELTNIESKLIAVEISHITKNQECLKISIEALSDTERNFILEKGQTTVELEKAKSESELTKNIIKNIPSIFKKK